MYKKLMFLISLVVLLGLAVGARAEELEVPWGETLIISDVCSVGSFKVEGCIIVTATGHLISDGSDDRSTIDGDGTDGSGGSEYAQLIINGGEVIVHSRFNIGQDHDGRLIVNDGGYFSQECCGDDWGDGFKFPDDSGGEHFIIVSDGEVHVHKYEARSDRHAKFELGCAGKITMDECDHGDDKEDPFKFYDAGDLYCSAGCAGPIINYVGDGAEAYCMQMPDEAWNPRPVDGAIEQVVTVDLEWDAGAGGVMRHAIYFGTSYDDVFNAGTTNDEFQGYKNVGSEKWDLDVDSSPPIILELWKTYYWRVDEWTPPTNYKGNVWSFTTGCPLVPGDINLDCLVNLLDYAMLADDWQDEAFFPSDVP